MSRALQRYFIGGLIVWLPIWATFIVVRFLVNIFDSSTKLLPDRFQPDTLFGVHIPGIGVALTIIVILLTGLIFTNFLGNRILAFWEKLLARIPLIRSIYSAVKQVTQTILHPKGNSFRKVMLIEYPRKGIWSIGFLTSTNLNLSPVGEEAFTIFIPTTPNPTSGFLMVVPASDARELDMSVEEALRMIISLGVVMPDKAIQVIDSPTEQTT
ncbi:MAG: DUF502 domain-containing protein [Gammaproteobacteria bacterium]|nr:DUF502 domain-containing protein [Gammaproteobacteria bacterium]MCH9743939.1 DUF502 domain-containing protein [Gammaproteobacteria bacterium]